jgi:hypothetical protein
MTQGFLANKQGKQLEDFVKNILESLDYQYIEKDKFIVAASALEQKFYTMQLEVSKSIYSVDNFRHTVNADFVLYNPDLDEKYFIIECKSQTSSGSVDEKYPYLNENIKLFPWKTIIVLDAPKAKEGAKIWLKKRIGENHNLSSVFSNFSEFREWAIKKL